jgi:hypothetical protein
MRSPVAFVAVVAAVTACVHDPAHNPVELPAPYNALAAEEPIESGKPIPLSAPQQEAVVVGVSKWMKDPRSVQFGDMRGVRTPRGQVVVCGQVNGRNTGGRYVGLLPFIGVLKAPEQHPDFIVVSIAASTREQTEVMSLCRQSGLAQAG